MALALAPGFLQLQAPALPLSMRMVGVVVVVLLPRQVMVGWLATQE